MRCHLAFYFAEFGLIWRVLIFSKIIIFLINNHFFLENDFSEKKGVMCPIDDLKVGSDWLADQE